MKSILLLAVLAVVALAFLERVDAIPSDASTAVTPKQPPKEPKEPKEPKDALKAAKEAHKSKKDCAKGCEVEYDPICVHDPNDEKFKPRTFGSQCALDVHNCEMGTKLVVKNKGECPGSGGVRLS